MEYSTMTLSHIFFFADLQITDELFMPEGFVLFFQKERFKY